MQDARCGMQDAGCKVGAGSIPRCITHPGLTDVSPPLARGESGHGSLSCIESAAIQCGGRAAAGTECKKGFNAPISLIRLPRPFRAHSRGVHSPWGSRSRLPASAASRLLTPDT